MAYILVIDDDPDFAEATAVALRSAGHEVNIESSTAGGQQAIARRRPDLLVLDVIFPESADAGLHFGAALRQDASLADMPILVVSAVNTTLPLGFTHSADAHPLPGPGASEFLEKPIDLDVFMNKVEQILLAARNTT